MTDQLIIAGDVEKLPIFQIAPPALALRNAALEGSALIGKVSNASENESAVRAQIELKRISMTFEKARKQLKEPLLNAGRQLDAAVGKELLEVDKEIGRLENLTRSFQLAEQRRVREEQELQQRELARIEAEKQAELNRIAREQFEAERKAKEAAEAAERLAAEATNKKQREAAEGARIESLRMAAEAASKAVAASQIAHETAQAAAAVEAKPITATRASGQVIKTDWEITITNPYELAKFHPDCILEIKPALGQIKAYLNSGMTIRGIKAEKITKSNVRAGAIPALIEV